MARRPANPELAIEAVLQERASAARGAVFTVPFSELLRAAGLGPGASSRVLSMVLRVCRSNGYRLVRVYAKKGKIFRNLNVEVVPHSRSLLVFKKRSGRKRKRLGAVAAKAA